MRLGKRGWVIAMAGVVLFLLALLLREPGLFLRDSRAVPGAMTEGSRTAHGGDSSPEPLATEPTSGIKFQIRNLADGQPVPGLSVHANAGAELVTADADEMGIVTLPTNEAMHITLDSPRWSAGPSSINRPSETGVYWVHGWIEVDGVVRVRGDATGFAPENAALHLLVDGHNAPENLPDVKALARWVQRPHRLGKPSADGQFKARVPRVHGITVAATSVGWKSARHTIDVSWAVESERVELWLQRALRIRGVARSSDGTPLKKLSVTCLSLVTLPATDESLENLRLLKPNGGFTSIVNGKTGKARVKFITIAMTDKKGKFELSLPFEGEVLIVAYPFGHRPVYSDLGVLGSEDVESLLLVAEHVPESSMIRVVANGKPVEGDMLFIADLSLKDGDAQPGVYVRRDAEGRSPSDWLLPDRRFFFQIGRFRGHLVWDGRDTLDVAKDLRPLSELPSR